MKDKKIVQGTFFELLFVYLVLSIYLWIQKEGDKTLFTVWNLLSPEIIHGIYMFSILSALAAGILIFVCFKTGKQCILYHFNAYAFLDLVVGYAILGKFTSKNFVWVSLLAAVMTLAGMILEKKGILKNSTAFEISQWKEAGSILLLWVSMVLVCIPVELYVNNPGNFQFTFARYCIVLIVGAILLAMLVFGGSVCFLNKRQASVMYTIIFALTILGYGQAMLLNHGLNILTGDSSQWSKNQIIMNACIWIVGFAVIFAVRFLVKAAKKIYSMAALYLALIQLVTTVVLMFTGNTNAEGAFVAFTNHGATEISNGNNVIVLLLDRFDNSYLETVRKEDEEFLEPLNDFIYYPDSSSQFSRTSMAVPYLLTGTEWAEDMDENTYPNYAYAQSNFLQSVVDEGYKVGIYSDENLVTPECRELAYNYDGHIEKKCGFLNTIQTMMKCSKYRMAPLGCKDYFYYYNTDITELIKNDDIWNIDNDLPFYQLLTQKGLTLVDKGESKGTFYFYHMFGTHGPTNLSEEMRQVDTDKVSYYEQTRASLKIVYEYLEQLKAIGKYDDATIIITADHGMQGTDEVYENEGIINFTCNPTVLVKKPNQHADEMVICDTPITQKEFIPTILQGLHMDYASYGKTYDEVLPGEYTVRDYASVWGEKIYHYEINGDSRVRENWKLVYTNQE